MKETRNLNSPVPGLANKCVG